MALSPIFVGQNHRPISFTWTDDAGTAINLTGATVTARFEKADGTGARNGTGTVNVTNAASGLLTYTLSTADVATAGDWRIQFTATYGDTTPDFSDPVYLTILATV